MGADCFRIGEVVLNAGTQQVSLNGEEVPLPPLSFSLLLMLARHAPNVVTTDQLEQEVWSGLVVDRGTINKRVVLVRNALREAGCTEDYITAVRGTGYRMTVPVETLEPPAVPIVQTENAALPARKKRSWPKYQVWALASLTLVLVITLVVNYFTQHTHVDETPSQGVVIRSPGDVDAYADYLKGRELMDQRISGGVQALEQAEAFFERAIEQDQGLVQAHVGMAFINFLKPSYSNEIDKQQAFSEAEASARFALELNPDAAEAHGVLGAIMTWRGSPTHAAAHYKRAMELGTKDPDVIHWQAMLFLSMGYFEQQVPILESALNLNQDNNLLGCSLASAFNLRGDPVRALDVLETMDQFSRRDLSLALSAIYTRDFRMAREMLSGIELRYGDLPPRFANLMVDALEDPLRFSSVEDAFSEAVKSGELDGLIAFEALLIIGSRRAFELEVDITGSIFEYRLPEPVWNNWSVELRRDPRFKAWVRALGYEQYWRSHGWPDRCRPTSLTDFECV